MITAFRVVAKPGVAKFRISGTLTESSYLARSIPSLSAGEREVHIHCSEIERLNSAGARQWKIYFDALRAQGITLAAELKAKECRQCGGKMQLNDHPAEFFRFLAA
jgi:hypothetical protein